MEITRLEKYGSFKKTWETPKSTLVSIELTTKAWKLANTLVN
jgi:hypothetical protein